MKTVTDEQIHQDNKVVAKMELHHMQAERRNTYIALEEMDYFWDEREVEEFERLWREGVSVYAMSGVFDRDTDEIALLVMDRMRKKKITNRPGGARGNGKDYHDFTSVVKRKEPCTPENFVRLQQEGVKVVEIARRMGMSESNLNWNRRKWAKEKINVG